MAIGYSHVVLIGNLGKDPHLIDGRNGKLRASFALAVDRTAPDSSEERREATDWFTIVAWGRVAETCRDTLSKGSWVFISGRLQARRWQDEKGNWHNLFEIVAEQVIPLNARTDKAEEDPPS